MTFQKELQREVVQVNKINILFLLFYEKFCFVVKTPEAGGKVKLAHC